MGKNWGKNGEGVAAIMNRIEQHMKKFVLKDRMREKLSTEEVMRMASWLVTCHHDDLDGFFKMQMQKAGAIQRVYTRSDFRSLVENLLIPEYRIEHIIDKVCDVVYAAYQDAVN